MIKFIYSLYEIASNDIYNKDYKILKNGFLFLKYMCMYSNVAS